MKRGILLSILLVFLFSCRKTELKDDKTILIGKWKWVFSVESSHSVSTGQQYGIQTLAAAGHEHSYKIEFIEKGKVKLWTDDECDQHRVVMDYFSYNSSTGYYEGGVFYNSRKTAGFSFQLRDSTVDTLRISNEFPFGKITENDRMYGYGNYFVRE